MRLIVQGCTILDNLILYICVRYFGHNCGFIYIQKYVFIFFIFLFFIFYFLFFFILFIYFFFLCPKHRAADDSAIHM